MLWVVSVSWTSRVSWSSHHLLLCHWTLLLSLCVIVLFGDSWCWSWVLQQWVYCMGLVWLFCFITTRIHCNHQRLSSSSHTPTDTHTHSHSTGPSHVISTLRTELAALTADQLLPLTALMFVMVCNLSTLHRLSVTPLCHPPPDSCFPQHSLGVCVVFSLVLVFWTTSTLSWCLITKRKWRDDGHVHSSWHAFCLSSPG